MRGLKVRPVRARSLLRLLMLGTAMLTAACVTPPAALRQGSVSPGSATENAKPANPGRKIAILLPLTGPTAELGQNMLKAAQLALSSPGSPELLEQDTGGNPDRAAAAARTAIAAGAGIIVGPLTATETAAVAPVARAANVPVLAFTSDASQSQPGVWAVGITPDQQMRRLVAALAAEHKTMIVAVVPQNIFGDALSAGLISGAKSEGLPEPKIVRTSPTLAGFSDALKAASDVDNRHGVVAPGQATPAARTDAAVQLQAGDTRQKPAGAPPFDALLLGVTGEVLSAVVPLLATYEITPGQVRILGPGTWAREAARQPGLAGAWYAAPDPSARLSFERQYTAKYNGAARDYASIAFDSATIARTAMTPSGVSMDAIERKDGFVGADGPIALAPDGTVRRGLGVFQVDRGGAHLVQPPPSLALPGA